jgi:hypothetical protein
MLQTNFGTDPEVFVVDNNGQCIPPAALRDDFGVEFIDEKTIIEGDDWRIIEDGAATEINIVPSNSIDTINDRISKALAGLKSFVGDNFDLTTIVYPTVPFDVKKYWEERDESFRDCVRFGCDPDLDIYSGEYSKEIAADNVPERFGGGHIHMQAPIDDLAFFEDKYFHVARLMDILVGNTGVAIKRPDKRWVEAEKKRLKFYGKPGKIRLQEYPDGTKGIEYRTPSNFWITNPATAFSLLTLMNSVFSLSQNPEDASKFLEDENIVNMAPKYIVDFNIKSSKNLFENCLDKLVTMRYLDYLTAGKILESAV